MYALSIYIFAKLTVLDLTVNPNQILMDKTSYERNSNKNNNDTGNTHDCN